MNQYFISPFYDFKRTFSTCYAEHKYTKQILLLPIEIQAHFYHPLNRLMGLSEEALLDLKSNGVFDFLLHEKVVLDGSVPYKEIANFFVRPQHPYLGLPLGDIHELVNSFAIFGVPYSFGNPSLESVPRNNAIARNYAHKYSIQKECFLSSGEITGKTFSSIQEDNIFDLGDLYINQREDISATIQKIADTAYELVRKENTFIAIGGDHAVTYPLFKGVQRHVSDLVCLQIDAHNDLFLLTECHFNDLAPSHSSVIGKLLLEGFEVHSLGIRDFVNIDSLAMAASSQYSCHFSHSDRQFLECIDRLIPQLSGRQIYLTIDIDVIDPKLFGSVTDPLPNGISFETLTAGLSILKKEANIIAVDIVEAALQDNNVTDIHNFLNFLITVIDIFYDKP